MKEVINRMQAELQMYEKLQRQVESSLEQAPEGHLRVNRSRPERI